MLSSEKLNSGGLAQFLIFFTEVYESKSLTSSQTNHIWFRASYYRKQVWPDLASVVHGWWLYHKIGMCFSIPISLPWGGTSLSGHRFHCAQFGWCRGWSERHNWVPLLQKLGKSPPSPAHVPDSPGQSHHTGLEVEVVWGSGKGSSD